ncbi:MAG: hypothetical protein R2877_04700 [Bdellovibrionota bacterium]
MATIVTDVKLPVEVDELKPADKPDGPRLAALYRELNFTSLLKKIDDPSSSRLPPHKITTW